MDSIFFVVKALLVTFVVVLFMQVKWGDQTLEFKAMDYIATSSLTGELERVADGAVRLIRNTWVKVTKSVNTNFSNALRLENRPGSRQKGFSIERSKAIIKENSRQAIKFIDESTPMPGTVDSKASRAHNTNDDDENIRARSTNDDDETIRARSTNDDEMIEQ